MLLNKKCVYLGVTLFSAMVLATVSTQTVKADTTTDTTTSTTSTTTGSSTTGTTTGTGSTSTTGTTTGTGTTSTTGTTTGTGSTSTTGTTTGTGTASTTGTTTGTGSTSTTGTTTGTGTTSTPGTTTGTGSTGTTGTTTGTGTTSTTGTTTGTGSTSTTGTTTGTGSTSTTGITTGTGSTGTTGTTTGTGTTSTTGTTTGTGSTSTTGTTTGMTDVATGTGTASTTTQPSMTVTPKPSEEAVTFYDIEGNPTGSNKFLADMGVKAEAYINGELYYEVGYGQLILASDYNIVKSPESGIARTGGSYTEVFNSYGQPVTQLAPDTAWKYDKIVTINDADYYEVAPDEYLPVDASVAFTPVTEPTNITLTTYSELYNTEGQPLGRTLPLGTDWKTDGCAIIDGVKMYRVASDEWVVANDDNVYEPLSTVFTTKDDTFLYDMFGNVESRMLPAGTSWKVDRAIMINGQKYCRVGDDEYVLAADQA